MITLKSKISEALDELNAALVPLFGKRITKYNQLHDGVGDIVTPLLSEEFEHIVWGIRYNGTPLFKLKLNINEDKRAKYNLAGKINSIKYITVGDTIADCTVEFYLMQLQSIELMRQIQYQKRHVAEQRNEYYSAEAELDKLVTQLIELNQKIESAGIKMVQPKA